MIPRERVHFFFAVQLFSVIIMHVVVIVGVGFIHEPGPICRNLSLALDVVAHAHCFHAQQESVPTGTSSKEEAHAFFATAAFFSTRMVFGGIAMDKSGKKEK